MEKIGEILGFLSVVLFWSTILSFVPIAIYLLIRNPPIFKAEKMRARGIFVLGRQGLAQKADASRTKIVSLIYGVCVVFFSIVYLINASHHQAGVKPFDVVSTLSVVLFGFSVITYLPIALYLLVRNPWKNREEAVCLTGVFIVYGLGLLAFSVLFLFHWLKAQNMPIGLSEILRSFFIVLFSAVFISYLPVCFYIFSRVTHPRRLRNIHPNIIFVIYSICLLVFAAVFLANWVSDKRLGVQPITVKLSF